jgi:hypothetical protein
MVSWAANGGIRRLTFARDKEPQTGASVVLLRLRGGLPKRHMSTCTSKERSSIILPESFKEFGLCFLVDADASVLDCDHEIHGRPVAPVGTFGGIYVESLLVMAEKDYVGRIGRRPLGGRTHGHTYLTIAIFLSCELDCVSYALKGLVERATLIALVMRLTKTCFMRLQSAMTVSICMSS